MTQPTLDYASAPPPDPIPLGRRVAAEFVGTFALVFAGCGAIAAGVEHVGVALAFGLTIIAMVIALGDVSGAHFNPAVSFAFAVTRRMRLGDAVAYGTAQCVAAVIAAGCLLIFLGGSGPTSLGATVPSERPALTKPERVAATPQNSNTLSLSVSPDRVRPSPRVRPFLLASPTGRSLAYEVVLTFFLVFVILCVAIGSKERGLMAGIAIGGTIAFCALCGGPVSGASMNPARSLGPALVTGGDAIRYLWIYWTAPFLGAVAAVGAWTYIYRHSRPAVAVHPVTQPQP